jgi:ABC-type oligopeptide transport system substrate-binding subunit
MKKKRTILLISCLILASYLLLVACGASGSPTSVAKKVLVAIEKGDTKTIEALMTPQAAAVVIPMGEKMQTFVKENGKITNTHETITGDKATVTFNYENGETVTMDLIREKGKWLVTFDK